MSQLEFQDWGEIPYSTCEERQLALLEMVHSQNLKGFVVFCSHPPVVTLGRSTQPADIQDWKGEICEVRRGGRATYHGPDQQVAYFILNIKEKKDVVGLLRRIESSAIDLLKDYGLSAQGKTVEGDGTDLNNTGVWISSRKIASVGIAVRNWISYHGIALNVDQSLNSFQGIQPCGFSPDVMTSLEKELQKKIDRDELKSKWKQTIKKMNA